MAEQPRFDFAAPKPPRFDGETFDQERDGSRLARQLDRVRSMMLLDEGWHTLESLSDYCGGSEASISARIRDLRKKRFGAYNIERRYFQNGVWEYRLVK